MYSRISHIILDNNLESLGVHTQTDTWNMIWMNAFVNWWCPTLVVSSLHYYYQFYYYEFQMEWNIDNGTEQVNMCWLSYVFASAKDDKTKEFEMLPSQLCTNFETETEAIVPKIRAWSNEHIHDTTMSVITIEPRQKHNSTSLMGQDIHQVLCSRSTFFSLSFSYSLICISTMFILRHCKRIFRGDSSHSLWNADLLLINLHVVLLIFMIRFVFCSMIIIIAWVLWTLLHHFH